MWLPPKRSLLLLTLFLASWLSGCGGGSGRVGTDIVVSAVSSPTAPVASGTTGEFVMRVVNAGGLPASNIELRNGPSGMTLTSIACVAEGGAVCPATLASVMTVPSMPQGSALVFTVVGTVVRGTNGQISNTLSASYADDNNRDNNVATALGSGFTLVSDLVVSGTPPAVPATGGGDVDFVFSVRNEGPNEATTVRILNVVGPNLQLKAIACAASGGGLCPESPSVSMEVPVLPVGGVLTFTVSATVNPVVNGTVVASIEVSADNDDDRSDNRTTIQASVVTARSGISVVGVGPPTVAIGGTETAFTMTVANAGPDPATAVSIANQVGSGLTLTAISCTAVNGASCPATVGPVMQVPSLAAGASLVFVVQARVASGANGTVINTMQVSAAEDADRTDNSATVSATAFTPRVGVYVSGVGPSSTAIGGTETSFVMTVGNLGPDAAANVQMVANPGSNLTLTRIDCAAEGGAACPATLGPSMTVPSMPVGGKLVFTVTARVALGANGTLTTTMQVSAENDTDRTDNSATAVGQAFTARSELSITGTGPSEVPAGTSAVFTMNLTNAGPDAAERIRLVQTVGGNLTLTGLSCEASSGATCPSVLGPTMEALNLPVGGVLVFTVQTNVTNATQGTITNTLSARVVTGFPSEALGVAVGSAYTNNVAVTASGPTGPLASGSAASFTHTVSNGGPGPAKGSQLSFTLSAALSLTGVITCTAEGGAICPASPSLAMTLPDLPPGGVLTFTLPTVIATGTNTNVGSTVRAVTPGDFFPGDNTATATFRATQ